jgi:hypothetical protein
LTDKIYKEWTEGTTTVEEAVKQSLPSTQGVDHTGETNNNVFEGLEEEKE